MPRSKLDQGLFLMFCNLWRNLHMFPDIMKLRAEKKSGWEKKNCFYNRHLREKTAICWFEQKSSMRHKKNKTKKKSSLYNINLNVFILVPKTPFFLYLSWGSKSIVRIIFAVPKTRVPKTRQIIQILQWPRRKSGNGHVATLLEGDSPTD